MNKYGCRSVTIAGAILGGVCLFASAFAQNVLTLIFTIGIGTGMGLGLIYLPAIVSVTMYFEKYRSLATGMLHSYINYILLPVNIVHLHVYAVCVWVYKFIVMYV